jgi:hypothetical protein
MGIAGLEGAVLYHYRARVRRLGDGVSAATGRGTVHVLAVLLGIIGIALAMQAVMPAWAALAVALVVVSATALSWKRRVARGRRHTSR